MKRGFLIVLSGPSGCGKGTVADELFRRNDDIVFSVSATTREARPGEIDGKNYFFLSEEEFLKRAENDEFLEYANVHGHYYGTPKDFVNKKIEEGNIVLLEIDVQGALQIKKKMKEVVFIFLIPPSMEELKRRLVGRGTESEKDLEIRIANGFKEINFVEEYDFFVVNDYLEEAVRDIESIIKSEKHRAKRFKYIKDRVLGGNKWFTLKIKKIWKNYQDMP